MSLFHIYRMSHQIKVNRKNTYEIHKCCALCKKHTMHLLYTYSLLGGVIYPGKSTLCKLFPYLKIIKKYQFVQEEMNCSVRNTQNGPKNFRCDITLLYYIYLVDHLFPFPIPSLYPTLHSPYFDTSFILHALAPYVPSAHITLYGLKYI